MKNYKYLLVNGCSIVKGSRIQSEPGVWCGDKKRFSKLLSDKLKCEEINISEAGCSNDMIIRTTFDWVENNQDKLNNTLCIIGLTELSRMELWDNTVNDYLQIMPNNLKGRLESEELYEVINDYFSKLPKKENIMNYFDFYFKYIYNEVELKDRLQRNIKLLLSFCKSKGLNDIIFFNSMGDHTDKLKQIKGYFSFDKKHDAWFDFLTEKHYVDKKGYDTKSHLPPYGKYFCGSHPSPIQHEKLSHQLYNFVEKNE